MSNTDNGHALGWIVEKLVNAARSNHPGSIDDQLALLDCGFDSLESHAADFGVAEAQFRDSLDVAIGRIERAYTNQEDS